MSAATLAVAPPPMPSSGPHAARTLAAQAVHGLAWATLAVTLCLIFAGARVTSHNAGMAVPDAPTTFGEKLLRFSDWNRSFGVFLEHSHRVWGASAGALMAALLVAVVLVDSRPGLWALAGVAMATVVVQGLLGQYRVALNATLGTSLALVHGCVAQLFLACLVGIVAMTSRAWSAGGPVSVCCPGYFRAIVTGLAVAAYGQIVLGATLRHANLNFVWHAALGYTLFAGILAAAAWTLLDAAIRRALGVWVGALVGLAFAQMVLGNAAALLTGLKPRVDRTFDNPAEAITTAVHLFAGSLFFAVSVTLALLAARRIRAAAAPVTDPQLPLLEVA